MKPYAIMTVVASLLLLAAMSILAEGCYWEGHSPGYYGDGYYGAPDPGYYGGDVIIEEHRHQNGGRHEEESHMPARRLPEPAPRSKPAPEHRQKSEPEHREKSDPPMGR